MQTTSGAVPRCGWPVPRPPTEGGDLCSLADQVLGSVVCLLQQLHHVRIPVREHGLDRGVERVVHALGRRGRLRDQLLVEDVRRNGLICFCGTLMYGLIHELASRYCALLKIGSAGTPTGCLPASCVLALRFVCCLLAS